MPTLLCTIPGCNIDVWDNLDGSYKFTSGFEVDGDGSGGNLENDPDFQDTTSLRDVNGNALNARTVPWMVLPPQPMRAVVPTCLGCRGQLRRTDTGLIVPCVVADEGPMNKAGEGSIHLAALAGVDSNPVIGGDSNPIYEWTFWPGQAALIDGVQYILTPLYEA
jgi:hypothetical protein